MSTIIAFIGMLAVAFGVLSLSQATLGAGIIGVGCFLGILARLIQAQDHQAETKRLLQKIADGDLP